MLRSDMSPPAYTCLRALSFREAPAYQKRYGESGAVDVIPYAFQIYVMTALYLYISTLAMMLSEL